MNFIFCPACIRKVFGFSFSPGMDLMIRVKKKYFASKTGKKG